MLSARLLPNSQPHRRAPPSGPWPDSSLTCSAASSFISFPFSHLLWGITADLIITWGYITSKILNSNILLSQLYLYSFSFLTRSLPLNLLHPYKICSRSSLSPQSPLPSVKSILTPLAPSPDWVSSKHVNHTFSSLLLCPHYPPIQQTPTLDPYSSSAFCF